LVAVLPLVRKRSWYAGVPVIKLAGAANVHSVRFEIVRKEGIAGEAALPLIWQLLKSMSGWDVLELPVFPQHGACEELIRLAGSDGFNKVTFLAQDSPMLHMQRDGNGQLTWLGKTTRHFRHELRRFGRLLEKETGEKPKITCHAEPHAETLHKFYEMEAAGWKGVEGSAINCDKATRSFYDSIAREATSRGYFRLHALEVNGRMTAGAFSVVTNDCFFPMKITYDESLRRGAPGLLLLNGIMQECAENGVGQLFFGGGKDSYKTSWTPETLPHFNGFVFNTTLRAQMAFQVRTKLLSPLGKYRRGILEKWRTVKSQGFDHSAAKSTDKNHPPPGGISLSKPGSLELDRKKENTPCK
jgi:Acetyltransferase (GNAT) domain